jgi:tetratricopeptide (TPR) repeat protein
MPSNVNLKYDFAEYQATYSQDHGVLSAKRRLVVKLHEVPVAEFDDYRSFVKNLQDDVYRYVQASAGPETIPHSLEEGAEFQVSIESLPDSRIPDANQLEQDALSAMKTFNVKSAEDNFKNAVAQDPKFTRAWLRLAVLYAGLAATDNAITTFRKAVDSDPSLPTPRRILAFVLMRLNRPTDAIKAWQDLLKIAPNDSDAGANLGVLLTTQKRYGEALPYLEAAAEKHNSPAAQNSLGFAYLQSGQIEKGTATLEKLLASNPKPDIFNDVAYELAESNASLPKALDYSQKAVDEQEKQTYDVKLSELLPEDLIRTRRIGAFWDTLGWVYYRLGRLDEAESYLKAAWLLSQAPVIGDHLGQVYEQQGKTEKAIHTYRLVLAALGSRAYGDSGAETRHRLERLSGSRLPNTLRLPSSDTGGAELSQLRSAKLKRVVAGSASAEFFLLFGPGAKIEDVQFISGSEKLKSAEQVLSEAKFQVAFPEHSSARLVRRAMLVCSTVTGCEAVLLTPETVSSVN